MKIVRGQRMQRQNLRRTALRFALLAPLLSLLVVAPRAANAQATAARSREADLSTFFAYSRVSPDYDIPGNGFTVGADYTKIFHLLSPALEVRFKKANGRAVNERTFGGGVRVERAFSYFRPYADFLISDGNITFAKKYYIGSINGSNSSIVYSIGGGLDYDFADAWSVRVDYQHENWDIGGTSTPITLTPHAISVGILYRFHLHNQYP